ncbi:MAG: FAD-dependent oxidoreductase [Porticoccaceae bacterium]
MSQLQDLFKPIQVGNMEVKNRLVMSSMSAGVSLDKQGYPTENMIAYYEERARSRPGMMGVGAGAVVVPESDGGGQKSAIVLYRDDCIEPIKALVDAVHRHDTRFGIQLWDGGIQAGGEVLLTPSGIGVNATAVVNKTLKSTLKVLSLDDIGRIIQDFADGAERCVKAGFDFVEIHAGHGYLISSFLTPFFNRRSDEYGGCFDNRVRFLLDILRAVKERVGRQITVGVKVNGDDYLPQQGWTLADTLQLVPLLEKAGADYLSVTAGVMGSPRLTVPPMYEPQGCFSDLAEEVKKRVAIPVSAVGRIKDPVMADAFVRDGKVDLVSMGRPMIADPELVAKARDGRLEDIRPCLADCRGCLDQQMRTIKRGEPTSTSCIVNPRVGRERDCIDVRDEKKANPKTILVVGAGCAGMEVARRAAFSGHKLILCEQRSHVGGQLAMAEMIPGRHEIGDIVPWYRRQLDKLGVEIRLGTEVNERLLKEIAPDEVVIATGSLAKVPQNMLESIYSIAEITLLMVDDVLQHKSPTGDRILVVGGEQIGMQVADYLSEQGKTVIIAEEGGHFAGKMAANDRWYLTGRLIEKGVKRFKHVRGIEILPEDQVWLTVGEERQHLPGIDTIVLASERQSDRTLVEVAEKLGIKTHVVGDAKDVDSEDGGTVFSSIAQGYDLGRTL